MPDEPSAPRAHDRETARTERLAASEHAALEAFAAGDLSLAEEHPESFFDEAAVLKGNAMGIIHAGDGSSNAEKVQRLLMLVPALLTVVDEARDTISRLRDLEDRLKPGPGGSIRVSESAGDRAVIGTASQVGTQQHEQRIYIRAAAREVEEAIAVGVPGSSAQSVPQDVTWRVIPVGALSVVVWRDSNPEPASKSQAFDWNYHLSAIKTWLETGTPLS